MHIYWLQNVFHRNIEHLSDDGHFTWKVIIINFLKLKQSLLWLQIKFRFLAIYKPFDARVLLSPRLINLIILGSLVLGLFWTVLPFMGWSYYSYEGIGVTCSVEWNERSSNVISYNLTILILAFFLPLACILVADVSLILMVNAF